MQLENISLEVDNAGIDYAGGGRGVIGGIGPSILKILHPRGTVSAAVGDVAAFEVSGRSLRSAQKGLMRADPASPGRSPFAAELDVLANPMQETGEGP